ncbi:DNA gyrase/topoisomerase IV subunit B [Mycoplasma sp. SG1]|uniref:DNA gyrase/topoisomerase IV subunit B n=1 Tax=Mycoplasma sp. SG1 TaxID=2810348 RepID=UPI002025AF0B|nr:DNA gyrase subunit B [Mycoplasma sp. SG1]URM52845.1 DNA gyrase subunit B [Mycoplasma sp. SG1]
MKNTNLELKEKYTDKDIKILEGLEAVRKRPGMYIKNLQTDGLLQLIWEIIDNSIDETLAGYCNEIKLIINDDFIIIQDNGRGIPLGINEKTQKSSIETVFNNLHAGGKFENKAYKISGGLHGVGASVVNGLSTSFEVWVQRDDLIYYQKYEDGGKKIFPLKKIGYTNKTGTTVKFFPDYGFFEPGTKINYEILRERIKQIAFLNSNLRILFKESDSQNWLVYHYQGGIKQYLDEISSQNITLSSCLKTYHENIKDIDISFVFKYVDNEETKYFISFCNNIYTKDGGTHQDAFINGFVRAINFYIREKKLKPKDISLIKEDYIKGLYVIFSIKIFNPQYEGQSKLKLINNDIKEVISGYIYKVIKQYFWENPKDAALICDKIIQTAVFRYEIKKTLEIKKSKSKIINLDLPSNLADSATKNKELSELFLVEGESAGGSAKLGRNREFQAILPLKGKVLNVQKSNFSKSINNIEIKNLINVLGCGIKENFNIDDLRYGKIIIMTDADVDGSHIKTLILTFFFNFLYKLIESRKIYIAFPPLFKVSLNKKNFYFYSDEELQDFKDQNKNKNLIIQRYKGLGEMNPEQLWETTMNPEKRKLINIYIHDFSQASIIFNDLMGINVEERKKIIFSNFKINN